MADKDVSDVSSQQANNPLTRKLSKILESRLDNDKVCSLLSWMYYYVIEKSVRLLNIYIVVGDVFIGTKIFKD